MSEIMSDLFQCICLSYTPLVVFINIYIKKSNEIRMLPQSHCATCLEVAYARGCHQERGGNRQIIMIENGGFPFDIPRFFIIHNEILV
jgi:hypothetical protein